jgi:hypothetical protein
MSHLYAVTLSDGRRPRWCPIANLDQDVADLREQMIRARSPGDDQAEDGYHEAENPYNSFHRVMRPAISIMAMPIQVSV